MKAWDVPTAQETLTIQAPYESVRSLAFDLNNNLLGSDGADLTLWNVSTGQEIRTLKGHTGGVAPVAAFSPDCRQLAFGGRDKTVRVWDVTAWRETLVLKGHSQILSGAAFSPDGRCLATASGDKMVKVWDAATGQEIRTLNPRRDLYVPVGLAFSPDSKRLAASGSTGTLEVWDTETGREVFTVTGHTDTAGSVAFSPDGQHLASPVGIGR